MLTSYVNFRKIGLHKCEMAATSFSSIMCESSFSFGHNDPLFSSTGPCIMTSSTTMTSNDSIWSTECQFDMPTPPVSPTRNNDNDIKIEPATATTVIDEDLDLGLGELINGIDFFDGFDPDSWINDLQTETSFYRSVVPEILLSDNSKCDVNELRHDCMWAGHCPAEEHRSKKDLVQLPCLLSSSPPESTVLSMATCLPCVLPVVGGSRTRLDTLGSIRPETPLSLSDSELDADQLTSDEGSNNNKIRHSSSCSSSSSGNSSSSGDESESDEDRPVMHHQPTLPPHIHPVRSHQIRKLVNTKIKVVMNSSPTTTSMIADHSYSHSDHSYHTQRRPVMSDHIPFDLGAPTPSDSGTFCVYLFHNIFARVLLRTYSCCGSGFVSGIGGASSMAHHYSLIFIMILFR